MTTTEPDRRRRLRTVRLAFAAAAALAIVALFDAARPDTTHAALGSVRLTGVAQSAPAAGRFGGFATDGDDDWAQQQAQLQEQLALQQMQQSMQQAEQQNEAAQQQAQQAEQQGQWVEDHPGP
jgi:hypothetical protein